MPRLRHGWWVDAPFTWFTADEASGQNPGLRHWLENEDIAYVMASRNDDDVPASLHPVRPVKDMIDTIPGRGVAADVLRRPRAPSTGTGADEVRTNQPLVRSRRPVARIAEPALRDSHEAQGSVEWGPLDRRASA